MTAIAISRLHFPVTTLGPGQRIGIWMQGCSIRCPGCIAADTWALGKGVVELDDVQRRIAGWLAQADGITISGGEPFDQPAALRELLSGLRAATSIDILVYTGYTLAQLPPEALPLDGLVDALMTGPFVDAAAQTLPLRGSDNQELHLLTPLGEARFSCYRGALDQPAAFDVMFDDDGTVWLAGIPARNDFHRLRTMLEQAGHRLLTSEDKSAGALPTRPQ
jgi:anaerobic ribonucleoside-triphosphate reductase activating protein